MALKLDTAVPKPLSLQKPATVDKPATFTTPPVSTPTAQETPSRFDTKGKLADTLELPGGAKASDQTLAALREAYGPAGDFLTLSNAQLGQVGERRGELKAAAELKVQFDADLKGATTVDQLKVLEQKYPPDKLSAGMSAKLMKGYMDASAWGDAAGYYQRLVKGEPQFSTYDIPREFFIVCLNKSGQLAASVGEGARYLQDHGVSLKDVLGNKPVPPHISGEVFAGLGKALKVMSGKLEKNELDPEARGVLRQMAKDANLPAGDADLTRTAMVLSTRLYEAGFTQDFEYYPGINAVYNAYATGDTARAEALAPMVMHACLQQGGRRSPDYWNVATQLELALMMRDPAQTQELLPLVLNNSDVKGWMLDSTATNIEALAKRRAGAGENVDALTFVAQKLRELEKATPAQKAELLAGVGKQAAERLGAVQVAQTTPESAVTRAIVDNSHTFKGFVSSYALGGNVQFGGQIPDICVSRQTIDIARTVLKGLDLEKTNDFEKWDKKVDAFLARTYKLSDPIGNRRPIEELHSPEHKVMDDFRKNLLGLMATPTSKDSRTDLGVELALGSGDCRHVAYSKQMLFDVWKRDQQVSGLRDAYTALQKGDTKGHSAAMEKVKKLDGQQLAVFTVAVKGPIKMNDVYDMATDAQGRPVRDTKDNLIENHTLTALLTLSDAGDVKGMQWRDSFYRELYQWGKRDVDINQALLPQGYDGGAYHAKTADGELIQVRMEPSQYSKGAAKAGLSAGEMLLAGQEVAPISAKGFMDGGTRDDFVMAVSTGRV